MRGYTMKVEEQEEPLDFKKKKNKKRKANKRYHHTWSTWQPTPVQTRGGLKTKVLAKAWRSSEAWSSDD